MIETIFEKILQFAIASYLPFSTSPFDISCVILIPKCKNRAANELAKQKNDYYHIKELYKTTCYKTKSNFSLFFFSHWLLHKCFFSFLIKAFANFDKLIRFYWQAFIAYNNGENLKMLIEILCQKLIVSNVILAFLDHLKPKIFFVGQPWWPTKSATSFENLWIRRWAILFSKNLVHIKYIYSWYLDISNTRDLELFDISNKCLWPLAKN